MRRQVVKPYRGWTVILAVMLAGAFLPAQPHPNKELDQFFKVKSSVFNQEWAEVRSGMEAYLRDYPSVGAVVQYRLMNCM